MSGGVERKPGGSSLVHETFSTGASAESLSPGKRTQTEQLPAAPAVQRKVAGALGEPGEHSPQVPGKQTLVGAELEDSRLAHGSTTSRTATDDASREPSRVATAYPVLARALSAHDPDEATIHDAATAAVEHKDAGEPVDASIATRVGAQLGADFAGVRVHGDPLAREATAALGARAFAHGRDVFLGRDELGSDLGLMAHELTHVTQQGAAGEQALQRKVEVGDAHSPAEVQADAVAAEVTTGSKPPAALLVDAGPLAPGQMLKNSFLVQLRAAVTAAANAELGPAVSADGCPYIEEYFGRYLGRPAVDGEAFLRRYAPDIRDARTAAEMVPFVIARVRAGVQHWRDTGQQPPELASTEPAAAAMATGPASAAALRAPDGRETLASLEGELGAGEALDGATAHRLADGLDADVSHARVHTGPVAARKAADAGALAFAVGEHVVMGAAAPAAGTLEGDALLAHELAHVGQQASAAADPVARRKPIGEESASAEHDADVVAGSALARMWGGTKKAARRIASLSRDLALQRCPASAKPAGQQQAEALRKELGLSITTTPEVGGSNTAYVGGQIQFGLAFAKPPKTHKVQATSWSLEVPGGGGFSTVPTGPTTMLPINHAGRHRFVVVIEIDDATTFGIEHQFDAIEPSTKTDELVADQQGVSLNQFQSQLALQKALLSPPGSAEQGKGAALHITTAAANPARQAEHDPTQLHYAIEDREAIAGSDYHWYAKPFRWDGLPDKLGTRSKVKLDDGGEAYDLGTGLAASFPASHQGTVLVLCVAKGPDHKPRGDARYLQSVLGAKEAEAVEKLVEHEKRVDGLADRFAGPTIPVVGAHVAVQTRGETALRLYLGRAKSDANKWLLIDMTPGLDPKQNELEYDGTTVEGVLTKFDDDNKYPKGAISLRIDANSIGAPVLSRHFDTDGKTVLGAMSSKAGLLSIILGLGAVIAAPFTGGGSLLVTALVIGSATAAATAGVLSLADHLQTEEVDKTAVTLDILTIVTSFLNAGLAVKALRGGPGILLASTGGRFLLWTNFTLEGVSAILVGVDGAEQIIKIVESDAPADEKMRLLVAVVANMILTGTLMVVSYGDIKATRGRIRTQIGKAAERLADADSLTLALLDDHTLGALKKAEPKQLNRLADMLRDDPSALARLGGRTDLLEALKLARGNRALDLELAFLQLRLKSKGVGEAEADRLITAMREAGVTPARIPGYSDAALAKIADPAVLDQLEAVGKLQKTGRIKGLDDWIEAAKTGATDPGELAVELREAVRQSQAKPDKVIHIGGDNRAPVRKGTTESMKSFDMTAESKGGKVSDSIEVTGLDDPIYRAPQIRKPIEHAAEKIADRVAGKAAIPGRHEVTVLVELGPPTTKGAKHGSKSIDPANGDMILVTAEKPPRRLRQGNLYDDIAEHLSLIGDNANLDVVTLVDRASGKLLARFERNQNTWRHVP